MSRVNVDKDRQKDVRTGNKERKAKNNKFLCWEIQNSMLSHGVGVSTDFNQ